MNILDDLIAWFSPGMAAKRAQYRHVLAAYEGSKPSRYRKDKPDNSSGDALTSLAGSKLRGYARVLDQNHDIARGILTTLVNNVVGAGGISIEPQPRDEGGEINAELAAQLMDLWRDWAIRPEVTHCHDWTEVERLVSRAWLRDGEALAQMIPGSMRALDHGTIVPFSLELLEADMIADLDDESKGIAQGVERNQWGRPIAYHLYLTHPGDNTIGKGLTVKRVRSDRIQHLKMVDRFRQARGVSVFSSVLQRLEHIKGYEESEMVAARVAAAMTGFIKRNDLDSSYTAPESGEDDRSFKMVPGMVYDKLLPGEDVGTIQSNRPSMLLEPFRDAMLRAVGSGTGANYSSISKNYNGTYSAQRQELVEGWPNYRALTRLFVSQFTRPVWRQFVATAAATGAVQLGGMDLWQAWDADFRGPPMPWIDPLKEASANEKQIRAVLKSAPQVIRDLGGNPKDVLDQEALWREMLRERGVTSAADPAQDDTGDMADDENIRATG